MLRRAVSVLAPPLCVGCGGHAGRAEPLCPRCRASLRWLGSEPLEVDGMPVWAPLAYDGPARAIVHALKFRSAAPLADVMAAQIAANAPPGLLDGRTLVPVPLHSSRRRRRGFNQAERLAAALGARTGLPVVDCLERSGSHATQMGRDRAERLAIAGRVAPRTRVAAPRWALLVDDVVTTGATLGACATALREAGTTYVAAVAYARTPGR